MREVAVTNKWCRSPVQLLMIVGFVVAQTANAAADRHQQHHQSGSRFSLLLRCSVINVKKTSQFKKSL